MDHVKLQQTMIDHVTSETQLCNSDTNWFQKVQWSFNVMDHVRTQESFKLPWAAEVSAEFLTPADLVTGSEF